jgi:hypothetical protein
MKERKDLNNRKVEVFKHNEWIEEEDMSILSENDIVRLFETDGSPLVGFKGATNFRLIEKPYLNESGIWTFSAQPMQELTIVKLKDI